MHKESLVTQLNLSASSAHRLTHSPSTVECWVKSHHNSVTSWSDFTLSMNGDAVAWLQNAAVKAEQTTSQ